MALKRIKETLIDDEDTSVLIELKRYVYINMKRMKLLAYKEKGQICGSNTWLRA